MDDVRVAQGRGSDRGETFVEIVAKAKVAPKSVRRPLRPGRHDREWIDQAGRSFSIANPHLTPEQVRELALEGAVVVYDPCGCGGSQCELDWLTPSESSALAQAGPPVIRSRSHGLVELEHWRD